jgi:hypothetical protein
MLLLLLLVVVVVVGAVVVGLVMGRRASHHHVRATTAAAGAPGPPLHACARGIHVQQQHSSRQVMCATQHNPQALQAFACTLTSAVAPPSLPTLWRATWAHWHRVGRRWAARVKPRPA